MQVIIKCHFNKQTRDSKKELVQFYVKGDDEHLPELNMMCREVVELRINGLEPLTAEFVKKSQDSKKTVLDFVVNSGASNRHSFEYYHLAGTDIELMITESQMDIDEFREQQEEYREGLKGKINSDGTVDVNQVTIEEAAEAAEESDNPMREVDEDLDVLNEGKISEPSAESSDDDLE